MNENALNTVGNIANNTANSYLEHGVIGATVVALFLVSGVLLYLLLRNNSNKKVIEQMTQNQTEFLGLYNRSKDHHDKVVSLLTQNLEIERANTKECYRNLGDKIDQVNLNLEKVMLTTGKNKKNV